MWRVSDFVRALSVVTAGTILLMAVLSLLPRAEILVRKLIILTDFFHGFSQPIYSSNVIIRHIFPHLNSDILKDLNVLCGMQTLFCYAVFTKLKNWNNLFEMNDGFFLAGKNEQWDDGSGRILLGDKTGVGVVNLRPIRIQFFGLRILTGLPCTCVCACARACVYIFVYMTMYLLISDLHKIRLAPNLTKCNYCFRQEGSWWRKFFVIISRLFDWQPCRYRVSPLCDL